MYSPATLLFFIQHEYTMNAVVAYSSTDISDAAGKQGGWELYFIMLLQMATSIERLKRHCGYIGTAVRRGGHCRTGRHSRRGHTGEMMGVLQCKRDAVWRRVAKHSRPWCWCTKNVHHVPHILVFLLRANNLTSRVLSNVISVTNI